MKKRPTLMEFVVVSVIISALVVVLFPILRNAKEKQKIKRCGANLHALLTAEYNYSIMKGPTEHWRPSERGSALWLMLLECGGVVDSSLLRCPLSNLDGSGQADYRGPVNSHRSLASFQPVGCDRPGNHGSKEDVEMNWVSIAGDIHRVPADSPEWADVLKETKD